MAGKTVSKTPETRGSDYVAIFVRQLGGVIVPPSPGETGTVMRVSFPYLALPPKGADRVAA